MNNYTAFHGDPEFRRTYLGASEAPEALGLSPYKERSPVRLCLEKQGKHPGLYIGDRPAVQAGKLLEPLIGHMFTLATGMPISPMASLAAHPDHDWMRAHTDFLVHGQGDTHPLLECKNYGAHKINEYGESGTDEVPMYDYIQCLHEAAVFGADTVYMSILFGGQEHRWYKIDIEREQVDMLIEREAEFWKHVENGTTPPPANGEDAALLYSRDNGAKVPCDESSGLAIIQIFSLKERIKELEEKEEELKSMLKLKMGAGSELVDATGKKLVSWKASKDSERFNAKAFQSDHPELYKQYMTSSAGSRRFLLHA